MATDNRPVLGRVDRPTLIVVAPGPFLAESQAMQQVISSSRLELFPEAGHALFVDEAERFNALLAEFLASLPAPAAAP